MDVSNYNCRPWKGHGAKKKGYPDIKSPIETLPQLMAVCDGRFEALNAMLGEEMDRAHLEQVRFNKTTIFLMLQIGTFRNK